MWSKKKIYALVFGLTVAICLFGFIWSWFATKDIRENTQQALNQSQKVIVKNLVLTETKNNKPYWELYAKSGEYDSHSGLVVLSDAIGNFYNEEGEVILSFQASRGTYQELNKIIVLDGDALFVAKDESSIRADKIVFKGQDEDIVASGNVQINRNSEIITRSDSAVFNSELTYFKIEGKSKISLYESIPELKESKK